MNSMTQFSQCGIRCVWIVCDAFRTLSLDVVGVKEGGIWDEEDHGGFVRCIMEFVRGLACTDTVTHCWVI